MQFYYFELHFTADMCVAGCGMVGIANAYAFVWIAQYYTDTKYKPVKQIAESSTTGHATNVIAGISIGLESTALPVLVMSAALISSYWLGNTSGKAQAILRRLRSRIYFSSQRPRATPTVELSCEPRKRSMLPELVVSTTLISLCWLTADWKRQSLGTKRHRALI